MSAAVCCRSVHAASISAPERQTSCHALCRVSAGWQSSGWEHDVRKGAQRCIGLCWAPAVPELTAPGPSPLPAAVPIGAQLRRLHSWPNRALMHCGGCIRGFAQAANGSCVAACTGEHCRHCSADPAVCTQCDAGWSPFDGVCTRCTGTGCQACEPAGTAQACLVCGDGSFYNASTRACDACTVPVSGHAALCCLRCTHGRAAAARLHRAALCRTVLQGCAGCSKDPSVCERCGVNVVLYENTCGRRGECHITTPIWYDRPDPGMLCCDYCTLIESRCRRRKLQSESCTPETWWRCDVYEPNRQPAPPGPGENWGLKCMPCDRTARPACAEFETERLSIDQPMCACRVCDEWMPPLCEPPL